MSKAFGHGFRAVDEQPDPEAFFKILDLQSRAPGIVALRAISVQRCEPSPGAHILEVGCGTGEVARELAALVRPSGKVVGIDSSEMMIAEALRRASGEDLPVEFVTGDAHALEYADANFDGVRSERMFQHLKDPARALDELVRVTKPGGRVVVADTDWKTVTLDHPDVELTRRIYEGMSESFASPRIGRQLAGMFKDAGLTDVTVDPGVLTITEWSPSQPPPIQSMIAQRVAEGIITEEEADGWLATLIERANADRFFFSVTMFCVAGSKP